MRNQNSENDERFSQWLCFLAAPFTLLQACSFERWGSSLDRRDARFSGVTSSAGAVTGGLPAATGGSTTANGGSSASRRSA